MKTESAGNCLLYNIQMNTNECHINSKYTQIFVYKKFLASCNQHLGCYWQYSYQRAQNKK